MGSTATGTKRRYAGVGLTVLALAAAAALSARWATPGTARTTKATGATTAAIPAAGGELAGDFTLWAARPQADPCRPRSEAPDIHAGAPVDVQDGSGATIAAATLAEGHPDPTHRGCVYRFTVTGLPVADAYTVQVGTRVGPTYPRADVAAAGWRVALNLGLPDPATG